jgi:hypothetical protein
MWRSWWRSSPYMFVLASGSYPVLVLSTSLSRIITIFLILSSSPRFQMAFSLQSYPPGLYALLSCPIFRLMMTNYEQRFLGLITKSLRYDIELLGWGGNRAIVRPTEILVVEGDSNSRSDSPDVRKMVSSALPLESPPGRALVQFFQNSFDLRPP